MDASQQDLLPPPPGWVARHAATLVDVGLLIATAGLALSVYLLLSTRDGWLLPAAATTAAGLLLVWLAVRRLHIANRLLVQDLTVLAHKLETQRRDQRRQLARVTADQQAAEALQHALLLALDQPVLLIDEQGQIATTNPAADALFGFGEGALTGQPLARVVRGQLRPGSGRRIALTAIDRQRAEQPIEGTLARVQRAGAARYVLALYATAAAPALAAAAPVAVPPASEPPASEPPASEPPASEPPASEPPASEPPASEPPASEPPASEPPASEPPLPPVEAQDAAGAIAVHNAFLATMGHDLRTPLNAILGLSEALLAGAYGDLDAAQTRPVEMVQTSGQTLWQLIDAVIDLAKFETGSLTPAPVALALRPVCQSAADMVRPTAGRRDIALVFNFPYALPVVYSDERRLRHLLAYWLLEAVAQTPDGGRVLLTAQRNSADDRVTLAVESRADGRAAPPDDPHAPARAQLIERLAAPAAVSLTRESAQLYRVVARFAPAAGPTAEATPPTTRPERVPQVVGASEGPLILLAEDNAINIETLVDFLAFKGYRVLPVRDGRQALVQAEALAPDLILMDIQMPHLNGLDAIRQLRQRPATATTPIIAVTGLAAAGDRERCLAAGANEYLSKPFLLDVLVTTIETLLADSA